MASCMSYSPIPHLISFFPLACPEPIGRTVLNTNKNEDSLLVFDLYAMRPSSAAVSWCMTFMRLVIYSS